MASTRFSLLLVTLLALVLVDNSVACKRAQYRRVEQKHQWYCPAQHVIFPHEGIYWCASKCAECPNGFCYDSKCLCFPGTDRDQSGVCGQICSNCDNGWCSSPFECVCNRGFTMSEGRCVRQVPYNKSHPQQNWRGPPKNGNRAPQRPQNPRYTTQRPQVQPQIPSQRFPSNTPHSQSNPQLPPQAPSVHPQVSPARHPITSRPTVTSRIPNRQPEHSLGLPVSPQHQSCQIDYMWDPETRACIPYESVKGIRIDPRMDD